MPVIVSEALVTWPLWILGLTVGIVFYVALGYLVWRGLQHVVLAVLRGREAQRRMRSGADAFHGRAAPTLFEVAVARAADERQRRSRDAPRRAA